ncbi:hypothetical protein PIB30_083271 [Stylosanthes scabra]|uniref:Uncharacterized protein n=1 Tax=Stylosanthes scabra TaxID=79078 RepID=A0ABU6STV6_9FABA|nr:hypothetical protein [Stylosanthes scabra]
MWCCVRVDNVVIRLCWNLFGMQVLPAAAAFPTISVRNTMRADGTGDFRFRFKLGGRKYELTLQHLANMWGLVNEGATFKIGNPHETWDAFDKVWEVSHQCDEYYPPPPAVCGFLRAAPTFQATTSLGHTHLWTRILDSLDFDLTRERLIEPSRANTITCKNMHQMRHNLTGQAGEGGDEDEADKDVPMEDAPPRFAAGTSSQAHPETGAPLPVQPDYAELIQRDFQEMRIVMSEGFAALSDRMDSLDIRMTSQCVDVQDLRSKFRNFCDSFPRPGDQGQQDPVPGQD